MPARVPLQLAVFDLDGTLIDSRADLVQSVNAMLQHLGRAPLPEPEVARMVGDGAPVLVQRALGFLPPAPSERGPLAVVPLLAEPEAEVARQALEYFLAYYHDHKLDATALYPGVADGLAALAEAGLALAVLTNKPVRASRDIVAGLGVGSRFFAIYGGNSFATKKPDPAGLQALLAEAAAAPAATVMVGDSAVDVLTGRNAGTWTCGVSYGLSPDSLAAQPPDWLEDDFPAVCARLLAGVKS